MNDPYVPTLQGFRRKIGPRSKYGMNAPQYRPAPRTLLEARGTEGRRQGETGFAASMREAREVSAANDAMFRREKRIANQAKKAEEAKKTAAAQQSSTDKASASASSAAASAAAGPMAGIAAAVSKQATAKTAAMSREERNKIEEERRAKGRAKAMSERKPSFRMPVFAGVAGARA